MLTKLGTTNNKTWYNEILFDNSLTQTQKDTAYK